MPDGRRTRAQQAADPTGEIDALIRSANSGNHTASSDSLCDSNEEYTTMLPRFAQRGNSDEMNSCRGSFALLARNS